MIKIRIAPNGTVSGLWDDGIDWRSLGRLKVDRASHVEFCAYRQAWYVRSGRPRSTLRVILQAVFRRPFGEIVHWAGTREEALAWEREHFGPGTEGWPGHLDPRDHD